MLDIFELTKNNVILKGIGPSKKYYNRYVFSAYNPESDSYDYSILFPRQIYSRNTEWNSELKTGWIDIARFLSILLSFMHIYYPNFNAYQSFKTS